MTLPFLGLVPATPVWGDADEPEDPVSGDVYFSRHDGLAETRAVFHAGCDLPNRWQDQPRHVICETGFGTGLNFLATWDLWRKTRKPDQHLHFISVEAHPMNRDDLARAHARFADLGELAAQLRAQWPPAIAGFHQLDFSGEGLSLLLLFGPVELMLDQLQARVDSWFLDGFAPAKNPDMWSDAVFAHMARLSASGAQMGTYTVAGHVRRGLAEQGFAVTRQPGHGRKRQRLHAVAKVRPEPEPETPKTAIVIGAGIAGACIAHALRREGVAVTVLDPNGAASAASGNARGLVNPRLDLSDLPMARLHRAAFATAVRLYSQACPTAFADTGILRHAKSAADRDKQAGLVAAQALPPNWAKLREDGLFLPAAGLLDPKAGIDNLLDGIAVHRQSVHRLAHTGDDWCVHDSSDQELARANLVFLANGAFPPVLDGMPKIRLLRGQISMAQVPDHGIRWGETGHSYVLPLDDDRILFGATHDKVTHPQNEVRDLDHDRNLHDLARLHPAIAGRINAKNLQGRAATRAASADQQAYAGPVPNAADMPQWLKSVRGKHPDLTHAPCLPGVFMLNGLGSRGLTLAPILAELVVAQSLNLPLPLERDAIQVVHPARDSLRRYRRGEPITD